MKCPYVIKQCSKCGKLLVANEMNFYKDKRGKYGLYAECKECRKEYNEQYYRDNKDKEKERVNQYYKDNPHVKFNNNIKCHYNLNSNITKEQYYEILEYFNNKCAYCGKPLDESNTTLDHIEPLSRGTDENVTKIWNIVPCCKSCNPSKHNKGLINWMEEKGVCSFERFMFILQYTTDMFNKYNDN